MILKNVPVRRGIAFLEPKCVVIKGHHVADIDAFQDRNFARALRERLRYTFIARYLQHTHNVHTGCRTTRHSTNQSPSLSLSPQHKPPPLPAHAPPSA